MSKASITPTIEQKTKCPTQHHHEQPEVQDRLQREVTAKLANRLITRTTLCAVKALERIFGGSGAGNGSGIINATGIYTSRIVRNVIE